MKLIQEILLPSQSSAQLLRSIITKDFQYGILLKTNSKKLLTVSERFQDLDQS